MAKRMITLMAALLVLGFVVAGCGDDESGDSGDTAAQTVTDTVTDDDVVTDTETETVTDQTDTDVTSDDNGGAAVPQDVGAATERCKDSVAKSQLPDSTKDSLQDICKDAASGNTDKVRDAVAEVCKKQAANIPPGTPGRDQAIAACDKARE